MAFYTDRYREEAAKLLSSIRHFDVSYHIEEVRSQGDWAANTSYKPVFIAECLERYEENIVYVDADATIEREPTLFDTLDCDVGFHRNRNAGRNGELLSGTIFLRNTQVVRDIVFEWLRRCTRHQTKWDQKHLDECLKLFPLLKVHLLPQEYCYIFDSKVKCDEPVIVHHQASRRLKVMEKRRK